jgi:hypothetical protein
MNRLLTFTFLGLGSLATWTVVPLGSIWLVTRFSVEPGTILLVSLPLAIALIVALTVGLGRVQARALGAPGRRTPVAWRRSLRDARDPRTDATPLGTMLAVSALLAAVALVVLWLVDPAVIPTGPLAPGNEHNPR